MENRWEKKGEERDEEEGKREGYMHARAGLEQMVGLQGGGGAESGGEDDMV